MVHTRGALLTSQIVDCSAAGSPKVCETVEMRYRSAVSDSARWDGLVFRAGDVVISTPPKSGTTWMQMLCALLVFEGPEFPAPLDSMSPWIDMLHRPIEEVCESIAAQQHRRFLKTHTPLDGLPIRADVTYVVVGRDPRDVATSFHDHRATMDFAQFLEQRAAVVGVDHVGDLPPRPSMIDDSAENFRSFIHATDLAAPPPNLANLLHHLETAWQRRHDPNVVLFHYADLTADLPSELRRLASFLRIDLTDAESEQLAAEASLERMRARADHLAPGASHGHWKAPEEFFRSGRSGDWQNIATLEDIDAYDARVATLVDPELAHWAHHGHQPQR